LARSQSRDPACRHIREQHPYWNATGGLDHFYFALNDRGACSLNTTRSELWAPIKLVHFGAYSKNVTGELGIVKYDLVDGSAVRVGARAATPGWGEGRGGGGGGGGGRLLTY
jgi:hypothetical protein